MKVTYNWLKEFVDIKVSADKLAEILTMGGLEVTSLQKKGGDAVFETKEFRLAGCDHIAFFDILVAGDR